MPFRPRLRAAAYAAIAGLLLCAGCAAPLRTTGKPQAGDSLLGPSAPPAAASAVTPPAAPSNPAVAPEKPGEVMVASGDARLPIVVASATDPVDSVAASPPEEVSIGTLAQETTLPEALQYAIQHHPRLRARQREVDVARAKVVDAGLIANPKLVVDYDTQVTEEQESEVTGRLMFTIPTANKIRLAQSAACAEVCHAQYAWKVEAQEVLKEAGEAGVDVLYYQELLGLHGRLSELAAQAAALQQGRFEAQQTLGADAIKAELRSREAELRRLETSAALDKARGRLSTAIGLGVQGVRSLRGPLTVTPLPAVPLDTLLAVAERNAPAIGEARAALTLSRRQLTLERANAVPDVEIGPRTQNFLGAEGRTPTLGARFAVDLPMFDRNQGAICESAAQVAVNQALVEDAALTALGGVASVYRELRSLEPRLQYYETKVLPLADRSEAQVREEQVARAIEPRQVLEVLTEVAKMRVVYLELRYRYATLYRELENLLGCPLAELSRSGGLAAAGNPNSSAAPPVTR
jgi:cobalt-zinc-cadmium efflux system outer membrane protein